MISNNKMIMVILFIIFFIVVAWASLRYWEYHKQAPLRAGISALKAGDYQVAIKNIRPFAQSGNSQAQELLGTIYAFGLGIPKDTLQARIWFRRAECNHLTTGVSEYYVALDYLDEGHLSPIDPSQALNWLQYAAEAGNSDAQRLLSDPAKLAGMGLVVQADITNYWQRFIESQQE